MKKTLVLFFLLAAVVAPLRSAIVTSPSSGVVNVGQSLGMYVTCGMGSSCTLYWGDGSSVSGIDSQFTGSFTHFHIYRNPGAYQMRFHRSYGGTPTCPLDEYRTITVLENRTLTLDPALPAVGQTVTFSAGNFITPTDLAWDFGDGTTTNGEANPAHAYATAGTWPVTLIATDTNACNLSDTLVLMVQVQSPANPSPAFTTEQEPCGGLTVSFNNATPGVGQQMLWDMGDGNTYTSEDATHTYATFGSYTVTLTVTDTLCGGSASTTQEVVLTATPEVEALFSVSSTDICSGLSVATTNESSGPASLTYSWDMGDGTVLSGPDATHLYAGQGSYTITLTAVDTVCLGSDTYTFEVTVTPGAPPAELFVVPNVFSPNGDGINDYFYPVAAPGSYKQVRLLQIFDRWGELVFHKENFQPNLDIEGWNGQFKGVGLNPGVYVYQLILEWNNGELANLQGDVSLIR